MPRPLARVEDKADARDGRPQTNKQNVAYHYDVSNEFYQLFLDPEMVYTCAYFQPDWHDDIARAQRDKLDMICRKLRLKPGERFSTSAAAGARSSATRRSITASRPPA